MTHDNSVNIAEGDRFSDFAYRQIRRTWHNLPNVNILTFGGDHFRGLRGYRIINLPGDYLETGKVDGSGTKPIIQTEALSHEQAGRDPIAMTAGDHTRKGSLPLIFFNLLDVSHIGETGSDTNHLFRVALKGLCDAAIEEQYAVLDGETAEMGACVGSENPDAVTKFIWAGFMIGVFREATMITGDAIEPGDQIIALLENGLRTNGYSKYRQYLALRFGQEYSGAWWKNPAARESIMNGARPPTLYDRFLIKMNGWRERTLEPVIRVRGIAHITGGGIPGKLAKDLLFPRGLSAELDHLPVPPTFMQECISFLGLKDKRAYKEFNCGPGLLCIVSPQDADRFIRCAAEYNLQAQNCGSVQASSGSPSLLIRSKLSSSKLEYGLDDV